MTSRHLALMRRPRADVSQTAGLSPVGAAAESVGHFVCAFCYPTTDVPAVSFCGSTRPPRLARVSGEHLTKCPMRWDVFNAGGFCPHYHTPRGGRL